MPVGKERTATVLRVYTSMSFDEAYDTRKQRRERWNTAHLVGLA